MGGPLRQTSLALVFVTLAILCGQSHALYIVRIQIQNEFILHDAFQNILWGLMRSVFSLQRIKQHHPMCFIEELHKDEVVMVYYKSPDQVRKTLIADK